VNTPETQKDDRTHVDVGFDDPPKLAETAATEEEKLDCYRRVRDEIRAFVEALPEVVSNGERVSNDR